MRNLKLTVAMAAVVAALSACGGGGGNDNAGVDNSAMTLSVTPSTDQSLPANSSIKLSMAASVRRAGTDTSNKVATMTWTVNTLSGESVSPVVADAKCAGMNVSGAQAGCETTLSIPQNVTTGKWNVVGTAVASNGTQRSQSFNVTVDNTVYSLSAGPAQVSPQDKNGTFGVVKLDGVLSAQNGPKIVSVLWTQVDGPATATIANANTFNASFVPSAVGKYTFQLTVVADDKTFNALTTVDAQPPSN